MTWISGRTISPASGELVFTIDEDTNLPSAQRWEQLWQYCTGIEPIVATSEPRALEYSDNFTTSGVSKTHVDHLVAKAALPELVREVAKEDVDPMSECRSYRRTLTIALVNFDVTDDGDSVFSSQACLGHNCDTISINVRTRGKNPRRADLDAALGNDLLRAICWNESRWRHFGSNGKPISHTNSNGTVDWGLMQINQATPEQQWNWQLNVSGGIEILTEKRAHAKAYLGRHPKDVTSEMIENETIQRYNSGAYYLWDAAASVWLPHPPNTYVSKIRGFMATRPW